MSDAETIRRSTVLENAVRGADAVERHLQHEIEKSAAERARREATAQRNADYIHNISAEAK